MQLVTFYLLEGGDFQGYIESQANPKREPQVVKRDEATLVMKVFDPIGRKVARDSSGTVTEDTEAAVAFSVSGLGVGDLNEIRIRFSQGEVTDLTLVGDVVSDT